MSSIGRTTNVRWIPNYIKAFGVIGGLQLWGRMVRLDRANREEPMDVLIPKIGAVWLRAATRDHAIFQQIWIKREYDLFASAPRRFERLMSVYANCIANGRRPLILDAGGHIGMSVLWWRSLFPKALIVAIEPSSANLTVLRRNVATLEDVIILHAALVGEPGTFRITDSSVGGSAVRVKSEGTGESVPVVTVAQIMNQASVNEILIAKIDIEGGEADLFAHNLDWLDHTHALAVETHDWLFPGEGTSRPLFAAISARSFDFVANGENILLFKS
jgi:FkbM family methyltransferase